MSISRVRLRRIGLVSAALLATTLGAGTVRAAAAPTPAAVVPCVTPAAPAHRALDHPVVTAQTRAAMDRAVDRFANRRQAPLSAVVTIPVYAHILKSTNTARPVATSWQIKKTVMVLNEAYSGAQSTASAKTRFRFAIVHNPAYPVSNAYDSTTDTDWYWATPDPFDGSASPEERAMKEALHQGGADALNLYLVNQVRSNGLLGWSTFPSDQGAEPQLDGVAINVNALPRGAYKYYNLGDTASHEVGHWLGLYHTFEGGCSAPGDEVTDTPREGRPTTGCPRTKNTCPAGAKDPVHNFMDYSYDYCMNQFTPGQVARMDALWSQFRNVPVTP